MLIPICTFGKDVDIFATDTLNRERERERVGQLGP